MAGLVDLGADSSTSAEERRIASEFLSRSTSRKSLSRNREDEEIYRRAQGAEDVDEVREDTSRSSLYGESSLLDSYHQ